MSFHVNVGSVKEVTSGFGRAGSRNKLGAGTILKTLLEPWSKLFMRDCIGVTQDGASRLHTGSFDHDALGGPGC